MERSETDIKEEYRREAFSLEDHGLVDQDPSEAFDALTRLAARLFDVPVSLISIVQEDKDRQFFTSAIGLSEPWASRRQTPLSHSFCQYVKSSGTSLVVENAKADHRVSNNLAVSELGVTAYLGVPIIEPAGHPIGALCVIDHKTRTWTDDDVAILTDLSKCASQEIHLRASALSSKAAQQKTERYNALRESIALAFMAPDLSVEDRFAELLRAGCEGLRMESAQITKIECDNVQLLFGHGITPDFIGRDFKLKGSLTGLIATGQEQIYIQNFSNSSAGDLRSLDGKAPCCYGGAPLIFDGVFFGTLEFFGAGAKVAPWGDEELSMLSIISMFACAHLGLFGQIKALQNSEAALLQYLLESKHNPMNAIS